MRLPELRLSQRVPTPWQLFCVLTAVALVFFSMVYWATAHHMAGQLDARLFRKVSQFRPLPTNEIAARIARYTSEDPGHVRPFGLFRPHGEHTVGDVTTLPGKIDGRPFNYTDAHICDADGQPRSYRGLAVRLPSGDILVIAIGIAGGALMHAASARRLRDVRRATQGIASGQLEHRLPLSGRDDDIDQISSVVNSMLDEVERLIRDIQGICAGIGHEVRTPMMRMHAGLERARQRAMSVAEYEQVIDAALLQSDIVTTRLSALLRIAQIGEATRMAKKSPLNLCDVLNDVIEFYEPLAEERSLRLELQPGPPTIVNGDADLLFSAFGNLLENALKFTPAGGSVTVTLVQRDDKAVVEVTDTGPGIAPDERDLVFRPFYRTQHPGGEATTGSGIGLSLVAAIVRLHNAQVGIRESGPGCCIAVTFAPEPPVHPTTSSCGEPDSANRRLAAG
jgi:signal transduction histidine kinase